MNRLLRMVLALSLVLAGGTGVLSPVVAAEPPAEAMDCCDSRCPCAPARVPAGTRPPAGAATPAVASATFHAAPARKTVPRSSAPVPDAGLDAGMRPADASAVPSGQPRGRDPDLGRHLAHLGRLRI